jgi:hypothetical protein
MTKRLSAATTTLLAGSAAFLLLARQRSPASVLPGSLRRQETQVEAPYRAAELIINGRNTTVPSRFDGPVEIFTPG